MICTTGAFRGTSLSAFLKRNTLLMEEISLLAGVIHRYFLSKMDLTINLKEM